MKNNVREKPSLVKDYSRASGMVLKVGKAVLGLCLFGLAKMGKVLINKLDKTGLPSSTGDTKKRVQNTDTAVHP